MENNVEKIMKDYKKEVEKIDKKYEVKEVKVPKKIDTKELDEKIKYEKEFIEKLKFESEDNNKDLIEKAKARLESFELDKKEIEEKNQKEYETYERAVARRETKILANNKLKNSIVRLDSGREVTMTEKDKLDRASLKDKAIMELTQEGKSISEQLLNKKQELEAKRKEWQEFKYEFDAEHKITNGNVVEKIHADYDKLVEEMKELSKMQEECEKYLTELKMPTKEDKSFSDAWNSAYKEETKPEKTEPKKVEPEKTESVKTELKNVEPEKTEPNKKEVNYIDINSRRKPEISRILVCPITNTISYEIIDEKGIYGVKEEEINYTDEFVKGEYVKELLEDEQFGLSEKEIKGVIGKVDPNILKVLEKNDKVALNNYIQSVVASKKIPFDIEYDLKDMYKSDMIYNKEKSNLSKIAKASSKFGVKISNDNIFRRTIDKIKSLINKQTRKALVEDNKTYGKVWEEYDKKHKSEENNFKDVNIIQDIVGNENTKTDELNSEKYQPRHLKKKYQPRHFDPRENVISKSKSIKKSSNNKVKEFKEFGKNTANKFRKSKVVGLIEHTTRAFGEAGKAFRDSLQADGNQQKVVQEYNEKQEVREVETTLVKEVDKEEVK